MIAWKVVSKGQRCSYSVIAEGKALVCYYPGKRNRIHQWLEERGYFPTVFRTKKQAETFRSKDCPNLSAVIKARCGKLRKPPRILDANCLAAGEFFENEVCWPAWPDGTLMVGWVMPLDKP